MDALKRARSVALHFEPSGPDYVFEPYVDGNGNGVRTAEYPVRVDPVIGAGQRLSERFPGVTFGLQAGLPDADGVRRTNTDGIRVGSARILATGPDGTATSGTLYVQGRRAQDAGPWTWSYRTDACDEVRTRSRGVDQSLIIAARSALPAGTAASAPRHTPPRLHRLSSSI